MEEETKNKPSDFIINLSKFLTDKTTIISCSSLFILILILVLVSVNFSTDNVSDIVETRSYFSNRPYDFR